MTPDPKRSPIAALAQTLRSGAAQLREKAVAEKSRNMRLQLANSAVMLDDLAARIEAAIAAQVIVWEDDLNDHSEFTEQWLRDLQPGWPGDIREGRWKGGK